MLVLSFWPNATFNRFSFLYALIYIHILLSQHSPSFVVPLFQKSTQYSYYCIVFHCHYESGIFITLFIVYLIG